MELKVGNYIRTPKGIGKITNIYAGHNKQEDSGFCIDNCKDKFYCGRSAMKELKSSPRIMDLVEHNDYINGELVIGIETNSKGKITAISTTKSNYFENKEIKSIVTHEMFESMEYKIGG